MRKLSTFNSQLSTSRGFTLIELLIVIAILGVLAAAVLVGIDPVDKINSANDSKVQSDIAQIANAAEAYAVNNAGAYPTSTALLIGSGDLKVFPAPPGGYGCADYYLAGGTTGKAYCAVKSKKLTGGAATKYWSWCSSVGKAGVVATAGNCPN